MADELFLVRPSKDLQKDIWDYRQEYFDFGEAHINGSSGMARYDDFDEWLEIVLTRENEKMTPHDTTASTFFSVRKSDGKIIGSTQLRHELTPDLEEHAGHIGYGIRPSERRKGYGKQQLSLVLDVARSMKIPKAMIICDQDNIISGKTAISCGGVLFRENVYEGVPQYIYWIEL